MDKVESLFSVTNFKGEDGMLTTAPLVDWIPETQEEADEVKANALRNPILVNGIVSPDGGVTASRLTSVPLTVYILRVPPEGRLAKVIPEAQAPYLAVSPALGLKGTG